MNRNRHVQYRRSIYRKRRIRTIVITVIVSIALLVALFLIIGNVFFDKTNEESPRNKHKETETVLPSLPAESVRQINGACVSLEGSLKSVSSAISSCAQSGAKEISVRLNSSDGKLVHHSDIASRLGYSILGNGTISVSAIVQEADEYSLYVSGIYYVSSFAEDDELARSVKVAELATVISESLRAGLDEVILLAPDITAEQCSEIGHLISEIRAFVPEAVIGFALPDAIVGSADAELIDSLAMSTSFIALDLTRKKDSDPIAFAEERTGSMQYYLLRYKMRVLIPLSENTDTKAALIEAVESKGIHNWQTVN